MASTNNQVKESLIKKQMSIKQLNEVTFTSKVLSTIVFISLPFIGFALGVTSAGGTLGLLGF